MQYTNFGIAYGINYALNPVRVFIEFVAVEMHEKEKQIYLIGTTILWMLLECLQVSMTSIVTFVYERFINSKRQPLDIFTPRDKSIRCKRFARTFCAVMTNATKSFISFMLFELLWIWIRGSVNYDTVDVLWTIISCVLYKTIMEKLIAYYLD